jgi:hypothetical protein
LNEYQEMIRDTKSDLEERLQNVDSQLKTLILYNQAEVEVQITQKERESIQQCLGICAQVAAHIDELRSATFTDVFTPTNDRHDQVATVGNAASARLVTEGALQNCKDTLNNTSSVLRRQLEDARRRLDGLYQPASTDPEEQRKMQEEIESIKESLAICAGASEKATQERISTYQRVSLDDDGQQVLVSTVGDLIDARNVSAGKRSTQWLGQMSDLSLQQLSRDHHRVSEAMTERATKGTAEAVPGFEDRHGHGRPLKKSVE